MVSAIIVTRYASTSPAANADHTVGAWSRTVLAHESRRWTWPSDSRIATAISNAIDRSCACRLKYSDVCAYSATSRSE